MGVEINVVDFDGDEGVLRVGGVYADRGGWVLERGEETEGGERHGAGADEGDPSGDGGGDGHDGVDFEFGEFDVVGVVGELLEVGKDFGGVRGGRVVGGGDDG